MKDLIDRHAAIDALHDEIVRRRINEDSNDDGDDGKLDEFDTEAILRRLPPTQPQYEELTPEEAASEIASGSTLCYAR